MTIQDVRVRKIPPAPRRQGALQIYLNVVKGLVLHDIKTRFFGNGLGQLVMILWPFVHILALLAIFYFSGRAAPYGSDQAVYCATGVIPFIIFTYTSRWIVFAAQQNASFLSYPVVKKLDLLVARAALEVVTGVLVTMMTLVILYVTGHNVVPNNPIEAALCFMTAFFAAICVGIFLGALQFRLYLIAIAYTLVIIVLYASSGIVFVPSSMPETVRYYLGFNPLLQLVEWMRAAYYPDYPRAVLDKVYIFKFALPCLAMGLLLSRVV